MAIKKKVLFLFFVLHFVALVSAAPPIVDFNWTPYPSPLVYQSITFDPNVTANPDLNFFRWQFHTDGNVNYTFGQVGDTNILFYDNFSDGTYLLEWGITSGSWDASGAVMQATSNTRAIAGVEPDMNILNADFNFGAKIYANNTGDEFALHAHMGGSDPQNDGNGYFVFLNSNGAGSTFQLIRLVSSVKTILINSTATVASSTDYNILASRTNGVWRIYLDGTQIGGTSSDTTHNFLNEIWLDYDGSGALTGGYFDDINYNIKSNSFLPINSNKNELHSFFSAGIKTVCLTGGNVDGNDTQCYDLNVTGSGVIQVFDENTDLPIPNPTAVISGQNYIGDSNGIINLAAALVTGEYQIAVSKSNYYTRFFTFLIDINQTFNEQIYLINNTLGREMEFLIRDENSEKYPNKLFRIEKNQKVVSSVYTNSEAITIPISLSNIVVDYNFFLDNNTEVGTTLFDYNFSNVRVLVPINEKTQEVITPFGLKVTDLTSIDANNLSAIYSFNIYPNTYHPYKLTLDANNLDYFDRYYHTRALPDEDLSIQPYMLRPIDNALSASMIVQNSLVGQNVPYYVFKFYSDIGQTANILVESPQSDSAGKFLFSSITGKTYLIKIYDEKGDLVETGNFINNSATEYVTDIFFGTISSLFTSNGYIDINVMFPRNNFLYLNDSNNFGFVYAVNSTGPEFTAVSTSITVDGLVVFQESNLPIFPATKLTSGQVFDANFTTSLDYVNAEIKVTIVSSSGTIVRYFKYPIRQITNPFDLTPQFSILRAQLGDFGAVLLWFLVAILLSIGLRFNPVFGVDNNAMIFVLMIWTGLAAFVGLIDIVLSFVAILGGFAYWAIKGRALG